jgi:RNA polymerase sigma-70 factor (ECF subfamily)
MPEAVGAESPFAHDEPADWLHAIESVGPASMLVILRSRMGPALRERMTPEDVWQETLLHAWRDRKSCRCQSSEAFRKWLLQVAENRIRDLVDAANAAKRGAGRTALSLAEMSGHTSVDDAAASAWVASTTPSRIAVHAEQARAMEAALATLPSQLRDVVRQRLFEELTMPEVAERLGIGLSAAKHRFREGASIYRRELAAVLGRTAGSKPADS